VAGVPVDLPTTNEKVVVALAPRLSVTVREIA
jgi:hypothetical protein